jgi:hypothetical protein
MNKDAQLTIPEAESALAKTNEPTTADMLRAVVDAGITDQNVGVLERLVALKERAEQRQAEREFAVAFNALQSEMPAIAATSEVPDKHGGVRYVFAAYETIMQTVRPLLMKHGFSVMFKAEFKEARIHMTCRLLHIGGHHEDTVSMVRVGSGPYGASDTQADGAAQTYAKRYALCSALNIVIERDTDGTADAAAEGEPITFEQAQTLREMVKDTGADEAKFLAYAGVKKYEDIGSNRYMELFSQLNKKRKP